MNRLLVLTLLLLASPPRLQTTPSDLDRWVQRTMTAFEVPGLSLAVVKDGKVVVAKGYGVRKLGEPAPVDARTLFGIASNTKVFTAAALGILVDEGKIRWDAPVIDYVPWFQMSDPYVTREMTVRDLLVHRSGLGLGALDLRPQSWVGLFERDGVPLEFALRLFEILVDLGLVVQVEGNRSVDLGPLERRKVFLNGLR